MWLENNLKSAKKFILEAPDFAPSKRAADRADPFQLQIAPRASRAGAWHHHRKGGGPFQRVLALASGPCGASQAHGAWRGGAALAEGAGRVLTGDWRSVFCKGHRRAFTTRVHNFVSGARQLLSRQSEIVRFIKRGSGDVCAARVTDASE